MHSRRRFVFLALYPNEVQFGDITMRETVSQERLSAILANRIAYRKLYHENRHSLLFSQRLS